ncbi:FHA domain-containing protein [Actinocatenispora rupis]|uniref:FHA domain-containing protein n=1 Tax=Actinocatenispora rupis TaxID=519421 RepID=A0A8J3IYU6_9ACTN|nr:FHA domain-containing protein [Actinocatenispora rupis]GID12551.1 hypothetical protein Aru02nite_34400 [Actinocatenispora rupis]
MTASAASKVELIPPGENLVDRISSAPSGTLFVTGAHGGLRVAPDTAFEVVFGRNEPDVHVCVGADDPYVSRRQGTITCDRSRWFVTNVGGATIRYPRRPPVLTGQRAELAASYVPLFVVSGEREHLLEVRIASAANRPLDLHDSPTARREWPLTDDERLALVCLAQRYLRRDPVPQPISWEAAAAELAELRPRERWNWRRVARVVEKVRAALSARGVHGLREDEVPRPIGNALNVNLILELLVNTTTLTPDDLALLGD